MVSLEALFTDIDDFCKQFLPQWQAMLIASKQKQHYQPSSLTLSEVMTLLILFHIERYRNFKAFYLGYVCKHLRKAFPQLVSYTRLLTLKRQALMPLCAFLTSKKATPTGIAFIDSTFIECLPQYSDSPK
jgi:flagellar motor switch protein FliG